MCVKLKSQYLLNGSENAFKNTFWNALMYFRFFFFTYILGKYIKTFIWKCFVKYIPTST